MAARRNPGTKFATRLSEVRHWRGVTQEELADRIGMARKTYKRLERDELANPPLRHLVNCAKALGVPLPAVLEPRWLRWFGGLPEPPEGGFWPAHEHTDAECVSGMNGQRGMPDFLARYLHRD
jgi:transcriptional regulator with XRE-family HTH domain